MRKADKETYLGRKIAFFYRDNKFTIEGIINDIQEFGLLVEITYSYCNNFYVVGEEYLIPFRSNFVYKFLS